MLVFVNYAHFSKKGRNHASNLVNTGKYLCNRQMTGQKKVTAMHDQ